MAELGRRMGVGTGVRMRGLHLADPKQDITEALGEIPPEVVMFSRILVAVYRRPEKTAGGIILTDNGRNEDVYQGKVGLVVAMGPQAYQDDESTKFYGQSVKIGDWVWFRPSDGMACEINGVTCRVFQEPGIIGKIPHPDSVW